MELTNKEATPRKMDIGHNWSTQAQLLVRFMQPGAVEASAKQGVAQFVEDEILRMGKLLDQLIEERS